MGCISSRDLWKIFGNRVEALKGVSVDIPCGKITALVGSNGAGKTTFIRIASGVLKPTSGYIEVLGVDVAREPERVRSRVALMPQGSLPPGFSTPLQFISTYLAYRGLSRSEAMSRAREILSELGLERYANTKCNELSMGTQQRVVAAAAIASKAELVFLDEPTSGLDPIARRGFWSSMLGIKEEGSTIVMTSHNPDEVEAIADYVVAMVSGRVVAQGPLKSVVEGIGFSRVVEVYGDGVRIDGDRVVRIRGITVTYYRDEADAERALRSILRSGLRARVRSVGVADILILNGGDLYGVYEEP
ncbi:MAG: ABC transporter ATP-binding protein [Sulfolobales archaeon]